MKAILFTQENEFNSLENRIHLYLQSKNGLNSFIYSANHWSNYNDAPIYEGESVLVIDENEPRYSLILECLTQVEIDSIVDIEIIEE